MRIGLAQFSAGSDQQANLASIGDLLGTADPRLPDLVVFPEIAQWAQPHLSDEWRAHAEPVGGPFTTAVDALASRHGTAVVVGMLELGDDGRAYNTLYATNGTCLGTYRKVHLYDAFGYRESDVLTPGDGVHPTLLDISGTAVGLLTCYDLRFPEAFRELLDAGAQVIVLPADWTPGPRKEDHWNVLLRARAIENTCFVVGVNQVPPQGTGSSIAVDPMGVVIGGMGETAGVLCVDLDIDRIEQVRLRNPSVHNRRFRVHRELPAMPG